MLNNLPMIYRGDSWILALTAAMQARVDSKEAAARSITDQGSLDKVSWNLPVEERVAGLPSDPELSDEDRRARLRAQWRSGGKVDLLQMQAVADAWDKGIITVTFQGGRVGLTFAGDTGIPDRLDDLQVAMRVIVPAHLPIDYHIRFLLLSEIHEVMTLDDLQSQRLSDFAYSKEVL